MFNNIFDKTVRRFVEAVHSDRRDTEVKMGGLANKIVVQEVATTQQVDTYIVGLFNYSPRLRQIVQLRTVVKLGEILRRSR